MCTWRLSSKDALRIAVLMDYIQTEHHKTFIMVTLTTPNVKGEDLKNEITRFNESFKKLCKRDEILKINHGYIRKLEVTYNEKRNDYNPHFHVLFAVNPSYFTDRTYIKQSRWLDLWQQATGDNTITQVDVRRIKKGTEANEMSKYFGKYDDFLHSQEVFDTFYQSLKGRQLLTYNSLFAQANKKYKNKELEHYKTKDDTEYIYLILYHWYGSEYAKKRVREITQFEYKELKKEAIDEMPIT